MWVYWFIEELVLITGYLESIPLKAGHILHRLLAPLMGSTRLSDQLK